MTDLPRISPTELMIMELLRSREMYGLEMVRESAKLKRGTIYVTLDRMTDKGLVRSRAIDDPATSGMPRRIYSLTAIGQRALHAYQVAQNAFTGSGVLA